MSAPEGFVWVGPPDQRYLTRIEGGQRVRRIRPVHRAWGEGFVCGCVAGAVGMLVAVLAMIGGAS